MESIIIERYQNEDGSYELELLNMNDVIENTKIISNEINPTQKYVRIYKKSLDKVIEALKLEKIMTQQCKKQVEQATAEYKIKLEESDKKIQASDNEIKKLKIYKQDSQLKIQASDIRIQQLESENTNIKQENLIFRKELDEIKAKLSL